MFDKCTIYTVYNRDDYPQISTPPNEFNSNRIYPLKQLSSSLNDYNNNHTNALLTTINLHSSNQQLQQQQIPYSSSPQHQHTSSPSSSIDGVSSCSISPKQFTTTTSKERNIIKTFQYF